MKKDNIDWIDLDVQDDDTDTTILSDDDTYRNNGYDEDFDEDDEEDRPSEFNLTVNGEFTVLLPGRSVPLVQKRTVSGSCTYQFLTDPAIGKESGLTQACLQMADMIVQYTTEAW